MRLSYNAPVILTFTLLAGLALALGEFTNGHTTRMYFATQGNLNLLNPFWYLTLVTHILGHANWAHFAGNFVMILMVGPLIEEKYGSALLLVMILITAAVTGLLNTFLFGGSVFGASGIVFMLIIVGSVTGAGYRAIPITFLLAMGIFIGQEVLNSLKPDHVSQFAHIIGGVFGGVFGLAFRKK